MKDITDSSVNLIVTSPPYPMIEMWDEIFSKQNKNILEQIKNEPLLAFENIHKILDDVWDECNRVLKPSGFVCINIGDATRTINDRFSLFSNHSRIIKKFTEMGFDNLPDILWRKTVNAPNKFMGSGMLPAGAYVTYEHEYILIFRKGGKREFRGESEKLNRQKSAYFWEERNTWFSDVWQFNGISQKNSLSKNRERTAAYPIEVPYRLINMYSVKGDTVLDPFLGTGSTAIASLTSERNSIGFEIDESFREMITANILNCIKNQNKYILERIKKHNDFIKERKEVKYFNEHHNFPVITNQEKNIEINLIKNISQVSEKEFNVSYKSFGES